MFQFLFGFFKHNTTLFLLASVIIIGLYLLFQFSLKYSVKVNFRTFLYDSPFLKINTDPLPTCSAPTTSTVTTIPPSSTPQSSTQQSTTIPTSTTPPSTSQTILLPKGIAEIVAKSTDQYGVYSPNVYNTIPTLRGSRPTVIIVSSPARNPPKALNESTPKTTETTKTTETPKTIETPKSQITSTPKSAPAGSGGTVQIRTLTPTKK